MLYEDPEYVVGLDAGALAYYNSKLKEDPYFEPPHPFYKVYEPQLVYDYSLLDSIPIKQSKRIGIEVLDEFIDDLFGFHIVEGRIKKELV